MHGLRTYLPGASLATHLDWPDAWVVSATLCVHRNASLPAWPLALSGRGIPGGTAKASLRYPYPYPYPYPIPLPLPLPLPLPHLPPVPLTRPSMAVRTSRTLQASRSCTGR